MPGITIRCPRCGEKSQAMPTFDPVVCVHCGKSILLPRKLVMEATNTSAEDLQKNELNGKLKEGFSLLETKLRAPDYDENTREALSLFTQLIKEDKSLSHAWYGLFLGLVNQCRKTFCDRTMILDSEYWILQEKPEGNGFVVESYFYRVNVDADGTIHSLFYDDTLRPGRKAHYYLNSAIACAKDEDKPALQEKMRQYFTDAPANMARCAADYLANPPVKETVETPGETAPEVSAEPTQPEP